jgi:WD domain, G-beta repeat/PQQ-like domain/WD40-like Beta Propeller Repeat
MRTHSQARMAGMGLVAVLVSMAPARAEPPAPRTIGSHTGGVASTHFSPDGKLLVSGGGDKMIRIWNVADAKMLHECKGPSSFTCAVRFSPDGKTIAGAGYESGQGNVIYLFDVATGKALPTLPGHPSGGIRRIVFTPDGKQLVSGGFDGTVRVWDLQTKKEVRQLKVESGTVYSLSLSNDGKLLATAGRDGLKVWDLASEKMLHREPLSGSTCYATAFSPDGKLVAGGDGDRVTIWEVSTGKEVLSLTGFKGELSQVLFTADGRSLLTASYDRMVRLFELRTGRIIHEAEHHTGWVWGIALSPDEKQVASCSIDTHLKVWDVAGLLGKPTGKAAKLTDKQRDEHMVHLASGDAAAAYRAVSALATDPDGSLPAIQKHFETPSGKGPTSAEISRMIRDLDADRYVTRQKASKDLTEAGVRALPALQRALTKPPSPEVRLRARRLLAGLDASAMPAEELIALRGVQALEYMGTPQAKALLQKLSRGEKGDRLTEEASQALLRLKRPADTAASVGVPTGKGS